MTLDPKPQSCLANLAALNALNDFDNIIGSVFELRVNNKYPKLRMLDTCMQDQFKLKSQTIAQSFTHIFIGFNLVI